MSDELAPVESLILGRGYQKNKSKKDAEHRYGVSMEEAHLQLKAWLADPRTLWVYAEIEGIKHGHRRPS